MSGMRPDDPFEDVIARPVTRKVSGVGLFVFSCVHVRLCVCVCVCVFEEQNRLVR